MMCELNTGFGPSNTIFFQDTPQEYLVMIFLVADNYKKAFATIFLITEEPNFMYIK